MSATYLAADFGATSGRIIAGRVAAGRLELEEVYRFPTPRLERGGHTFWDFPACMAHLTEGLRRAASRYGDVASVAVDTWGVDFGLLDAGGELLGLPYCYRDESSVPCMEKLLAEIPERELYGLTGLPALAINSIYRLMAIRDCGEPDLARAAHLLFMPDLFAHSLCGSVANEYTIASTSQLLDVGSRRWDKALIRRLGFPEGIFGEIVQPGSLLGHINGHTAAATGLSREVKVVAAAGHDTACAVYAAASAPDYIPSRTAFLSSGTWSLLGIELERPIVTEAALNAGFSNEGGTEGRITFLQNITGLWILQRLIEEWRSEGKPCGYAELIAMARESDFEATIDVDASCFNNPQSMSAAIASWLAARQLPVPLTQGDAVRCVLASLADRYRKGICQLNSLLPEPVAGLHIIGGGSRNELLNELTARATGLQVTAGQAEATAIGNILIQARSDGAISRLTDINEIKEP